MNTIWVKNSVLPLQRQHARAHLLNAVPAQAVRWRVVPAQPGLYSGLLTLVHHAGIALLHCARRRKKKKEKREKKQKGRENLEADVKSKIC